MNDPLLQATIALVKKIRMTQSDYRNLGNYQLAVINNGGELEKQDFEKELELVENLLRYDGFLN